MRRLLLLLLVLIWIHGESAMLAQGAQNGDEAAIRAVLAAQAAAWNRGDVTTFMRAYEDSPETTFMGSSVRKGYQPILKRYRENYANAAQMGALSFSNVAVRLLPSSCGAMEYAVMTGNFHLDRTQRGTATKDDGIFSLVWRKSPQGWKIVLDHTS
jgi:uncharacterized protein (TIGR02246 family)